MVEIISVVNTYIHLYTYVRTMRGTMNPHVPFDGSSYEVEVAFEEISILYHKPREPNMV